MIRMGRSSKPEPTNEQGNLNVATPSQPPRNTYQPANSAPQGQQAMTESETMARDIKEGRLSGFVGSGTVLTGETHFQAMLRIDGHLTGTVTSTDGTLIVGSTGQVDANVKVSAAVINGTVNGDIIATDKLELGRSARVAGNIQSPRLVIEDGAILEGSCSMLKAQENLEKRRVEHDRQVVSSEIASKNQVVVPAISKPEEPKIERKEESEKAVEAAIAK
jgi:cytoskeletal protein CcmA (bactofilin family)